MKRIAIIIDQRLDRGKAGNVAAILMGQAAVCHPEIYNPAALCDQSGIRHAAICYNTILLAAEQKFLMKFAQKVYQEYSDITCIMFTQVGQNLHNAFVEYQHQIRTLPAEELNPIGVIVIGEDETVRAVTKRFSILK